MLFQKFANLGKSFEENVPTRKENSMSSNGKKDKGNKEQKKKPKHNLKEKRKLKKDKQSK